MGKKSAAPPQGHR